MLNLSDMRHPYGREDKGVLCYPEAPVSNLPTHRIRPPAASMGVRRSLEAEPNPLAIRVVGWTDNCRRW